MLTATQAIKTIEALGGYEFIRRQRYWNGDTNRHETLYKFDGITLDCLAQLRWYAKQFAYTHGVEVK
jgi:hypothetical protein